MTYRLDSSYVPCWARGIIEDLEIGIPGHEAVASAAASLHQQADEAEACARRYDSKVDNLLLVAGWIGTDTMVRQYRADATESRARARDLRLTAADVAKLKGEFIPIARLLR